MPDSLNSEVFAIAKAVHCACVTSAGGSAGNCKDATLALAFALEPIGEPVAICQGKVLVSDVEHDHYWCRIGHTIIDPTADQFGILSGPLIAHEISLPHYKEASFFVFNPAAVTRLLKTATKTS